MSQHSLLKATVQVAKTVATFIDSESSSFTKEKIEYKGKNDLVSYVDKAAEGKLLEGLSKVLPEAGFIGEEGTSIEGQASLSWIIDPLDGTTNFTHGLPIYAVSIGLKSDNGMELGVVVDVSRGDVFSAAKGNGAFMNDEKIQVSGEKELKNGLIATGFPYYDFDLMTKYLELLRYFMENTHGVRRMGSAAVDLCYTACGRFEAFYEYNLKPWDVAGGSIIVEEAGGIVTDFHGNATDYSGRETLAACGIHPQLVEVIKEYWGTQEHERMFAS